MLEVTTNSSHNAASQHRQLKMTKTMAPTRLLVSTKTSSNTRQPSRNIANLAGQKFSETTCGSKSEPLRMSTTRTRVPSAVRSAGCQPVANSTPSPLSPPASNGRTSTSSDTNSDRSISSCSLPRKQIGGAALSKIGPASCSSSSSSSRPYANNSKPKILPPSQTTKTIDRPSASRSRLIAPKASHSSSVLPKLVTQQTDTEKSSDAIASRSVTLERKPTSLQSKIRRLEQPINLTAVSRIDSRESVALKTSGQKGK
jgi:hypothetical protein